MAKPSELIPFQRSLKRHQAENLDRFFDKSECAALWEMGTGKTTLAIALLRAKFNMSRAITKTLIISPVATLYNWQKEFGINAPPKVAENVFVPYMKSRRMKFKGSERAQVIHESFNQICVLNPESLDNDEVMFELKRFNAENVIVDEADTFKGHAMYSKNPNKQSPSRLNKLLTLSDRASFRMIMTGTPFLNDGYQDIWSQWRILDRGDSFTTNFFAFRETWFEDKNIRWKGNKNYFPRWEPKAGIEQAFLSLMDMRATRVTKEECLDLPPLEFETYYVEMGKEQEEAYNDMEETLVAEIDRGTCSASNALSKTTRLLQILSGHMPVETFEEDTGEIGSVLTYFKDNPRLAALENLLIRLTPQHKVIVWCRFANSYESIRNLFRSLNLEFSEVTGESKNKQEEIDRFQNDPRCRVMLGNPRAGGIGINLTAASYAIYFSRCHSLRLRLQSLARNHRGGAEIHRQITAIDIVCKGTLDEEVLNSLHKNEEFAENILTKLQSMRYRNASTN